MRLITFILMIALAQVSAKGFGQKISLNENNVPLEKVLKSIRQQSGYEFIYNIKDLKDQNVTIKLNNVSVEDAVKESIKDLPLSYKVIKNNIVLTRIEPSFLDRVVSAFAAIDVRGIVLDETGNPLVGATVKVKDANKSTKTNAQGEFYLQGVDEQVMLMVSYLGYENREVVAAKDIGRIVMALATGKLDEVNVIVNTGYQKIPKERATGSFAFVDSALLNRAPTTNILDRLKDVTPGLIFNSSGKTNSPISIRGQNTISANADPLIVIDNFPYHGDLNNLNPSDVLSITVLKDAAAASIWGARASNGVIVITTRKGKAGHKPVFSFNTALTSSDKPDLYYKPTMSVSDYIETERRLFSENYYVGKELSVNHEMLSPVIELLIAARNNIISIEQANTRIEAFKQLDSRNDINNYVNQKGFNQQYNLSMNGGNEQQRYFFSTGFDRNMANTKGNVYQRITINANQTTKLLKGLDLETGFYLTRSETRANNESFIGNYPYARLRDENGDPAIVFRDYRIGFIQQAKEQGLLNWEYRPLEELGKGGNRTKNLDYRINAKLNYQFFSTLSATVLYQYQETNTNQRNLYDRNSYYARNLTNSFTKVNPGGNLFLPIPALGILDQVNGRFNGQNLRGQLNFNPHWNDAHELNMVVGAEIGEQYTRSDAFRNYGYDDNRAISTPVDYANFYPSYINPANYQAIPGNESATDLTDRSRSYYANLTYTYKGKYAFSGSGRKDQSNLFGVKANQKGVPLYSLGLSWNISREDFYSISKLSYLKLRTTYGYNGNSFTNYYAFTTAYVANGSESPTLLPFARIDNPPNPNLRWERTRVFNIGVDFAAFNKRITGSLDYYLKSSTDLLGMVPLASSTGVSLFSGNFGSTKGKGFELVIGSKNLSRKLKWQTDFMVSMAKDRISEYTREAVVTPGVLNGNLNTIAGKPLYAISSYAWAGLNPQNGNPRGYVNGSVSEAYSAIISQATFENIAYHGYAQPPYYGSLRNTFNYGGFTLSANISFRLGYYFRKESINYSENYGLGSHGDYSLRWKTPGDELRTYVPSIPVTYVQGRDDFYKYSPVLVDRGDHIRLQDIKLGYQFKGGVIQKLAINNLHLYFYANQIGVIWKKNSLGVDPDYLIQLPVKTYSFGLKADF